jgi:uncharacterized membrane protein
MGLLSMVLTFPIGHALVAVGWVAAKVGEAAEAEWRDPARVERALHALEQRLEAGEIDEVTYEAEEAALLAAYRAARLSGRGEP